MKRTMATVWALVLCCGITACSGENSEQENISSVSEQLYSYKAAPIGMADFFSDIYTLNKGSAGSILVFGKTDAGGFSGYITDGKFSDYEEFCFTPQEDETVQSAAMLSYGKKGVLTRRGDDTFIYIYSADNTLEKTLECGEVLDNDDTMLARLYGNGDDGFIINIGNSRIIALSPDGKLLGDVKTGETISGVSYDSEKELNVLLTDFKEISVNSVDVKSLSTTKKCSYKAGSSSGYAVGAGAGEYRFIYVDNGAIYGLTDTDKVKLADFANFEFHEYEVQDIAMVSDTEIAILLYSGQMYLLTEQDISELKAKEVITMASWSQGSGMYDEEVKYFNSHNDNYKIEYKPMEGETFDDKLAELRLQIISGDAPDLLPQVSALGIDSLNPAAFADLYEFIDNDPELSREDFLPNVAKSMERDGRMIMIAPTFTFLTVQAKGYPGVRENWSVDDFIYAYENKPEDKEMFGYTDSTSRSAYFSSVVKNSFFIDYDNAKCHFDSPEFIKLLHFFNDNQIGLSMTEYDNLSGDFSYGLAANPVKYGNRFVDFDNSMIQWFGTFLDKKRNEYDNDYVLAGYPYDGKRGGSFISISNEAVAITATSSHKEGAWEFLRMMLSDEYYTEINPNAYLSFPVLKNRFDELAGYTMQDGYPYFAVDENYMIIPGKFEKIEWKYWEWDSETGQMTEGDKLEPFSQEEFDYFYNIVTNAEVLRSDYDAEKIINEETWRFFDDECTAEECADRIQDRVSLYLSERY